MRLAARTIALLAALGPAAAAAAEALPPGEKLPPATAEQFARGEWLMHDFCLACHVLDSANASNPFRPKIREDNFGTPELAYANIGRLNQIRPQMAHAFRGNEDDRRALAHFLARMAAENRPAWWKVAAPYAALLGGVLAAGAFFLRSRKTRA